MSSASDEHQPKKARPGRRKGPAAPDNLAAAPQELPPGATSPGFDGEPSADGASQAGISAGSPRGGHGALLASRSERRSAGEMPSAGEAPRQSGSPERPEGSGEPAASPPETGRAGLRAANDQLVDGAAASALFKTAGDPVAEALPSASFSRSSKAAAELAAALKQEFSAASRRGAKRLGETAGRLGETAGQLRERVRAADYSGWATGVRGRVGGLGSRLRTRRPDAAGEAVPASAVHKATSPAIAVEEPAPRRSGRSWLGGPFTLRGAVRTLAFGALAGLILMAGLFTWALIDVPWREIAEGSLKPIVVLETADGKPLVRQGPFQGTYAKFEEFPPHLIDAVVSIEDRRFFEHHGVDLRGVARAMVRNVRAGEVLEGGSTITQQLIKVLYLESDRTWKRKLQEVVIAFWLEAKLGKQEILARYLNNVYLGAGATGMPAAARIYFNKEVGKLNLRESAMLAGLIRSPSQLNPIDNYDGARNRAAVVLDTMVQAGKIDANQALAANAEFAELHPTRPAQRSGSWFADWVSDQAREIAGPFRGSITVKTTIVPRLQRAAEEAVRKALEEEGGALGVGEAALVAMTPDGAVVAMVGGRDYEKSQFNRAATAMRQPGSTFKLFVYYAALKAGFGLEDRIEDGPIEIDGWTPENAGGDYAGRVSLAEAFARSLNGATVALAQEVGLENVAAAAKELGIDSELALMPALALGASEVSLLDLTGAYASVRAGAAPIEPWGIANFQAEGQPRSFRVGPGVTPAMNLRDHQKELVTLLQLVVEGGTGKEAAPGVFAAGKTGTSQNNRDAWFVGFTEPLVAGVWVGNDDDTPMKEVTGGALPARIWRDFMQAALADTGPAPAAAEVAEVEAVEEEPAACNVRACSRAYRSFRASDCTFQPFRGERRLCEK